MVSKKVGIIGTEIIVILFLLGVIFPMHQTIIQQAEAQGFVLPCTVATYGNAWDGVLAFGLTGPSGFYLVVMSTNGTLLSIRTSSTAYELAKNIAQNTIMFQGEPQVGGPASSPTFATHIWNFATNTTQDFPNVIGHHDIEYNPISNTFLTLQNYVRQVGNVSILFDKIVQLNSTGGVIWSWDTYDHISLSQLSSLNETVPVDGQLVQDFTHGNALDWDYNKSIIYFNARHTNTFYKINQTSGNLIWSCGQFGNFTLLGDNGTVVPSLWYHSHDTVEIAPNVFTMFDNDYNNLTYLNNCRSRMMELTLNETIKTARVNWSWQAPKQYWTAYAGGMSKLPNGNYLGDFADPTHQFTQNQPWDFNNTGAVLIEVNPSGQVVRNITFPVGWYIYRVGIVTNLSQNPFNPTPSPSLSPSSSPSPNQTLTAEPTSSPTIVPTFSALPSESSSSLPSVSPSLSPSGSLSVSASPSVSVLPSSSLSSSPTVSPSVVSDSSVVTYVVLVVVAVVVVAVVVLLFLSKRRKTISIPNSNK